MKINTPCIGICSTAIGDAICRGCRRTAQEVIDWNRFDSIKKQHIFDRLGQAMTKATAKKIQVLDSKRLQTCLDALGIRYRDEQSPYCWAYELLREGANYIQDLTHYGIQLKPAFEQISLSQVFSEIDEEIYQLACRIGSN